MLGSSNNELQDDEANGVWSPAERETRHIPEQDGSH